MGLHSVTFSHLLFILVSLAALVCSTASQSSASVTIDASRALGPIGDRYNVGYDGWGDITNAGMVAAFQELGVRYCRIGVDLTELCGERPGDYRWE